MDDIPKANGTRPREIQHLIEPVSHMKALCKRRAARGLPKPLRRGRSPIPKAPRSSSVLAPAMAPQAISNGNVSPSSRRAEVRPSDALQLYYREIGQVKLLTPQEELELARRIRKGDSEARQQMIQANLRLVVKIARDYEGLGLPLLDLINEGNLGLIKGVERFDPAKGAKLSTYSAWWIKQSIKRALANQVKTIRLPLHVVETMVKVRRMEMRLHETLEREPTHEELAEALGILPLRLREYLNASKTPVSLETPLGTEEESTRLSELVADSNAAPPFERLVKTTDTALARQALATLTTREQTILNLRFGLEDDTPQTLEVIGRRFGITRERIRQIESDALKKLRRIMEKRDRPPIQAWSSFAT